jgi:hypothetical protein
VSAVLHIQANGAYGGQLPVAEKNAVSSGQRGTVAGWSHEAARRNERWLRSVHVSTFFGKTGLAVTLTTGEALDAKGWREARGRLLRTVKRCAGVRAYYWLTEFQDRGAPHLHLFLVVAGDVAAVGSLIVRTWLRLVERTGALHRGQSVQVLDDGGVAWLIYLGRHGARAVEHYQRARSDWKGGRMWGYGGQWVLNSEPVILCNRQWFAFRRLVLGYLRRQVRADLVKVGQIVARGGRWKARNRKRLDRLRLVRKRIDGALRSSDRWRSEKRGVSVWCDERVASLCLVAARDPSVCGGCERLRFGRCEPGSACSVVWRGIQSAGRSRVFGSEIVSHGGTGA